MVRTIAEENALPGAPDWGLRRVEVAGGRSRAIEGWCWPPSAAPGESVEFFVSAAPHGPFSVTIFRLGYYGGAGARRLAELGPLAGMPQPDPAPGPHGERECVWDSAFVLPIAEDWVSGVYLARLTRQDTGSESYVPFVVRPGVAMPAVLVQTSDFCWQAYNRWPDDRSSLYDTDWWLAKLWPLMETADRDRRVSFDRPFGIRKWDAAPEMLSRIIGSAEFLQWEFPLVYWLEREGVDVGYWMNRDTHERGIPAGVSAWISNGHDEYWSPEIYANVAAARDRGVSLLFLSGNAAFTEIELAPASRTGDRDRVFRRRRMFTGREADLMGVANGFAVVGDDDWRCADAGHWLFAGTGMRHGDAIRNLVGWETHSVRSRRIPNLRVVASGTLPLRINAWLRLPSQRWYSTVYELPGGGVVFAASTIYWGLGLARPPVPLEGHPFLSRVVPDERVAIMTRNLLRRAGVAVPAAAV